MERAIARFWSGPECPGPGSKKATTGRVHAWTVGYNGGWCAVSDCGYSIDKLRLFFDPIVKVITCVDCIVKSGKR